MGLAVANLVGGLVVVAVIVPTLVAICAKKATSVKEPPIGASMANRRAAAMGKVQIDPLLQPQWAAQNAAQKEIERKQQQAVVIPSRNGKTLRTSEEDELVRVVLRQPSTMADKYALPSHLTKQLGQSSRRGLPGTGSSLTRTQGASAGGRHTPEPSSPLQRPEPAYTNESSVPRWSRNSTQDPSGGVMVDGRSVVASTASRRMAAASPVLGPVGPANGSGASTARPSLDVSQPDAAIVLREEDGDDIEPSQVVTCSIAWPGLNDTAIQNAVDGSNRGTHPPRANHPRVAALSPMLGARNATAPGGSSGAALEEAEARAQMQARLRPSSEVTNLVAGVDWTSAVPCEGDRRVGSAISGPRPVAAGAQGYRREQSSAPPSADITRGNVQQQATASVPGASFRGGTRVGFTISGREVVPLPSRDVPPVMASRWTAQESTGSRSSSMRGAAGLLQHDSEPGLPGSADGSVTSGQVAWGAALAPSEHLEAQAAAPRVLASRSRGMSFGTESAAAKAAAGLAAGTRSERGAITWSGMVASVDVEAGLGAVGGGAGSVRPDSNSGSRAARAQALLARNKSNLSRLGLAGGTVNE